MIAVSCLLVGYGSTDLKAAALLMDDFTGPGFTLSSSPTLPGADRSRNDAAVAASRFTFGEGDPEWLVTVDPLLGSLTYSLNMRRGQPTSMDGMGIIYGYADRLASFAGLNAVQLQVDSIVGSGTVSAFVPTGVTVNQFKVDLAPGALVVPLLNPSGADPMQEIVVRIYPTTPNFSVTLSSLWLVPEPGVSLLTAVAGGWLASRRRRDAGRA